MRPPAGLPIVTSRRDGAEVPETPAGVTEAHDTRKLFAALESENAINQSHIEVAVH